MSEPRLKPFLKWAGGKRWLFESKQFSLPEFSGRYIEPFLGGGAAFFHRRPRNAVLTDTNERLIELYQVIRDQPRLIEEKLREHALRHSRSYYYAARTEIFDSALERAALFLYLNRACWNGLYRENLKGLFNVPIGTKQTIVYDDDDFIGWSETLNNADIFSSDFEAVIDSSNRGDFLFIDPPYTVKHNMNGFVRYNQKIFAWEDQIRLRDALARALMRGASFVVTNANHISIREIYSSIGVFQEMRRYSVIAGNACHRSQATELLIRSVD